MKEEQIRECLEDAGCGPELAEQLEALRNAGRQKEQLRLLGEYRRLLLDRIHAEQKKLDCLDYLVWSVKMNDSAREGEGT